MLELKKGDKVEFLENIVYILSNGQKAEKKGDIILISSDVKVQSRFFKLVEEKIDIDEIHQEALKMHSKFLKAEKDKIQERKIAELKAANNKK